MMRSYSRSKVNPLSQNDSLRTLINAKPRFSSTPNPGLISGSRGCSY